MFKYCKTVLLFSITSLILILSACGINNSSGNINNEVLSHSKKVVDKLEECYSKIFSCNYSEVQSYSLVYMEEYYNQIEEGKLNENEKKLVDDVVSLSNHLDELFIGNHESAKMFEDELATLKEDLNMND